MLSYVEYYRPKYFILENVERMINHPLAADLVNRKFVGGVPQGMLKLITASLASLGFVHAEPSQLILIGSHRYQHQIALMQAGRYGVPQNRERVIILASRGDIPLPKFPLPTHTFNRHATRKKLANGEALQPIQRSGGNHPFSHDCLCAPLPAVTVDNYLDDLVSILNLSTGNLLTSPPQPAFNWSVLQYSIIMPTDFYRDELPAASRTGFTRPVPYASPPKNSHQYHLRGGKSKVSQHYTKKFGLSITERCV
jgi:DNA (cytosine-5)-methyltransferase 1